MKTYEHSGVLFVSLNAAEHVALTLPEGMLDDINKAGVAREDQFMFFANEEGSLLRISREEYEIQRKFPPKSPFDEQLKKLLSEHFLASDK
jgi:hypothetical protein